MSKNLLTLMKYNEYERDTTEDFITEGEKPGRGYFDASLLDDAPGKQFAANGSEVYVLHIAFPTQNDLLRAIKALSNGQRAYILPSSKEVAFNGVAQMRNSDNLFIELWEEKLSGIKMPKKKKGKKKINEDEAVEPPPF